MAWIDDRAAEKMARHFAVEAHRATTPDLREAIDHLARGFRLLRELGAPSVDLLDVTGGTLDIISNIDGERIQAMDDCRQFAEPVDDGELRQLHNIIADKVGERP